MPHRDTSWRVGAIYRACIRYGMDRPTCEQHMRALGRDRSEALSFLRCSDIWWRNMEQRRREYASEAYQERFGYCPFLDDPTATPEEVLRVLRMPTIDENTIKLRD